MHTNPPWCSLPKYGFREQMFHEISLFQQAGGSLFFVSGNRVTHEHGNSNRTDATGYGSDPAGDLFDAFGVDIADNDRYPIGSWNLINADIDNGSSGLH